MSRDSSPVVAMLSNLISTTKRFKHECYGNREPKFMFRPAQLEALRPRIRRVNRDIFPRESVHSRAPTMLSTNSI